MSLKNHYSLNGRTFSIKRDRKGREVCARRGTTVGHFGDLLLLKLLVCAYLLSGTVFL